MLLIITSVFIGIAVAFLFQAVIIVIIIYSFVLNIKHSDEECVSFVIIINYDIEPIFVLLLFIYVLSC